MAPIFLPIETSVSLNVLIFGLTLVELTCGLLGAPSSVHYSGFSAEELRLRWTRGAHPAAPPVGDVRQISIAGVCVKVCITRALPANSSDYGLVEEGVLFVLRVVGRVLLCVIPRFVFF